MYIDTYNMISYVYIIYIYYMYRQYCTLHILFALEQAGPRLMPNFLLEELLRDYSRAHPSNFRIQ